MKENISLSLENVSLETFFPEHVTPNYLAWLQDKEVMQFTEARFAAHTEESLREYVRQSNAKSTSCLWRIMVEGCGHVGNVALTGIDFHHKRSSLGLIIGDKRVWGLGVGTRAVMLATRYAFDVAGLEKITAGIYTPNQSSIRIFEKAGYRKEATLKRQFCLDDGSRIDSVIMSCFPEDLVFAA